MSDAAKAHVEDQGDAAKDKVLLSIYLDWDIQII